MKRIVVAVLLAACGAQHVKVEPLQIQPIHITVDVNLNEQAPKPTQPDAKK